MTWECRPYCCVHSSISKFLNKTRQFFRTCGWSQLQHLFSLNDERLCSWCCRGSGRARRAHLSAASCRRIILQRPAAGGRPAGPGRGDRREMGPIKPVSPRTQPTLLVARVIGVFEERKKLRRTRTCICRHEEPSQEHRQKVFVFGSERNQPGPKIIQTYNWTHISYLYFQFSLQPRKCQRT